MLECESTSPLQAGPCGRPPCIGWPKRRAGWVCVWRHERWALHWLAKNSSYSCGGQGTCASLQVRRGGCRVGLAGEFGRGRRVQLPAFRVSPSAGCAPARLRLPCWSFAQLQVEERGFVQSAHLRQCGRWIRGEGMRTTRTDMLIGLDFAAPAIGNAMYMCHPTPCVCTRHAKNAL